MSAIQQIEIPGIPAPKPQEVTALAILQDAVIRGASIDTIERLAALQERMLGRQAEDEFNIAMNATQSELGRVAADLTNPQTHSKYASYAALDRKVRPIYTKHGFSLSFDTDPTSPADTVLVLCYVSHKAGHTRTYRNLMPSDGKGAKGGDVMTKTHATGAAESYGMRYLLKMIFNIAIGEEDNDGNKFSALGERLDWVGNCRDESELNRIFKSAYQEAFDVGDVDAMKALVTAKDARKAAIREGR
jgi:hypothetical protein